MSEVRLVVAILVPAIFTLILKDFFDLFMTNRYEGKVKQYTIWMLYFLLDTVISMNFKFVGVISMLYSFIILIAYYTYGSLYYMYWGGFGVDSCFGD